MLIIISLLQPQEFPESIEKEAKSNKFFKLYPTNLEILKSKIYLADIRKNIQHPKRHKLVCTFCGEIFSKLNYKRHLKNKHQKVILNVDITKQRNYMKEYGQIHLGDVLKLMRKGHERKLSNDKNHQPTVSNRKIKCFLCKETMHTRSLRRHTTRKHNEVVSNLMKLECKVCHKTTLTILAHTMKYHRSVYESWTPAQIKVLRLMEDQVDLNKRALRDKEQMEVKKMSQQYMLTSYLNYRRVNLPNQTSKNLKYREDLITSFTEHLQKNNFTFERIYTHNDGTEYMEVFKNFIENKNSTPSTKYLNLVSINDFLTFVGNSINTPVAPMILETIKMYKKRVSKERAVEYTQNRLNSKTNNEVQKISKGCLQKWFVDVMPHLTKVITNEELTNLYDRTIIYGAAMIRLCHTNATRTSDIFNIRNNELSSAQKMNGFMVVRVANHKTKETYGPRNIILTEEDHKALIRISKLEPESEYCFKSYNGEQLTCSNTLKYMKEFQKKMGVVDILTPKDFRDSFTDFALSQNMGKKVAHLMRHSTSTQHTSYAPRQSLEEEIEAVKIINQIQMSRLNNQTGLKRSRDEEIGDEGCSTEGIIDEYVNSEMDEEEQEEEIQSKKN